MSIILPKENVPNDLLEYFTKVDTSISSLFDIPVSGTRLAHCAAFTPDLLITPILSCTDENDIILDPFAGISTVGVVAEKYNRRFIGIELSEEFMEISRKRLGVN